MTDADSVPSAPILDPAGHVAQDLNCIGCGYNLRTLHREGLCPECGLPVGRSIEGDRLMYQNPEWIETVARGISWLVTGIILSAVLGTGIHLVLMDNAMRGTRAGSSTDLRMVVRLLVHGVYLIGCWKLTTPEPRTVERETSLTVRQVIRICAVLNLPLIPIAWKVASTIMLVLLFMALGIIVFFTNLCAVFIYLRRLALRLPDESLALQARLVMWGLAISFGISFLLGPITALGLQVFAGSQAGFEMVIWAMGIMRIGLGAGKVVFGLWALVLLLKYRRALTDAAFYARFTLTPGRPSPASPSPAALAGEPPAADN